MKTSIVVYLVFMLIVIIGCKHEIINPANTNTGGGPGTGTATICFEADILPIFKSNCAKSGCHDVTSQQKGYIFDTYANIVRKDVKPGNASDSKVYKMLIETDPKDRMPKAPNAPLSVAQIDLIKRWINEGAKNTTNCGTTCDTTIFTYSAAVRPLLDANCVGCHSGPNAGNGIDFTTYNGVRTVALDGRLIGAITHSAGFSQMPKGSNKLVDCKITQIRKWIQSGAPNN